MSVRFAQYCTQVEQRLGDHYHVGVITRDIPDPLTGDLDGAEIHIDVAVTDEQRLFLLAHLFGHTVQWNTDPAAFELGRQYKPPVDERLYPAILNYESEAACYGLSLLHEVGITEIDQWFSNYTACDQAYLVHFYRTGEKGDFQSFWRDAMPLLVAKAIPDFLPSRRVFRTDGVVI